MTRHYATPLSKARYWLGLARKAVHLRQPALAVEPGHNAVHNSIVALRNFLTRERGKVHHPDVATLALRLGLPEPVAREVEMVESMKAPFEYGAQFPTEETGVRFHRTAEAAVAHVEAVVRGRAPGRGSRRKKG